MLSKETIKGRIDSVIGQRRLLNHPFYQKWTAGLLKKSHLQYYAKEYFHFVLREPQFLSAVHSNTPHFPTKGDPCGLALRQKVLSNLIGEEHGDDNHPKLWKDFCLALGLAEEDLHGTQMLPGTEDLITCFLQICRHEPFYNGLSAMYAFESQIPEVAEKKIEGLNSFYDMTNPNDYRFFSVHREADVVHSSEEMDILNHVIDSEEKLSSAQGACRRAADALLGFLTSIDNTYCSDVSLC